MGATWAKKKPKTRKDGTTRLYCSSLPRPGHGIYRDGGSLGGGLWGCQLLWGAGGLVAFGLRFWWLTAWLCEWEVCGNRLFLVRHGNRYREQGRSILVYIDTMISIYYRYLIILIALVGLSGCTTIGCCFSFANSKKDSSINYFIIGFGLLTVPKPEVQTAILATKMQALGAIISDQSGIKLGLGYSSSQVVAIPNSAKDVRVEISEKPGGSLVVDAPAALLSSDSKN